MTCWYRPLQAGLVPAERAGMSGMFSAEAIPWTLPPLIESDPLALTDDELIARALAEADAYRELLGAALGLLHERHRELVRLREQHLRLIGEYRALRVRMIGEAA